MPHATASLVPVLEMPVIPSGSVNSLQQIFDISLTEYVLLTDCQRDDRIKFGLDPRHVTSAQKPYLTSLKEKAYVRYSVDTGKWELTTAGRLVLLTAAIVVRNLNSGGSAAGTLLQFPAHENTKGNSA